MNIAKLLFISGLLLALSGASWLAINNNVSPEYAAPADSLAAQEIVVTPEIVDEPIAAEEIEVTPEPISEPSPPVVKPEPTIVNPIKTKAVFDTQAGHFDCSQHCFWAAVDKTKPLPGSYYPATVVAKNGKRLTPETTTAMLKMISAMSAAGINAEITSGFRSYETQKQTFYSWVNQVKASNPGISQAAAEAEANTYSAYPGHSEHQLGTTADLNTVGAVAFDHSQNKALYDFIENNAHLYGFVITYPKDMQASTGYVHEPWHVRYLGVEVATRLHATGYVAGNGTYSTQFLRDSDLSD